MKEVCQWCNKIHAESFICVQKFMYELITKIYAVEALDNHCNSNNHVLLQELRMARDMADEQILFREKQ